MAADKTGIRFQLFSGTPIDQLVLCSYFVLMRTRASNIYRLTPDWQKNLAEMIKRNVIVRANCRKCGTCLSVNLDMLKAYYGSNYSLIDQHPQCRVFNCDGEVLFLASTSPGMPFRPLKSH